MTSVSLPSLSVSRFFETVSPVGFIPAQRENEFHRLLYPESTHSNCGFNVLFQSSLMNVFILTVQIKISCQTYSHGPTVNSVSSEKQI